mmetsp:Transcript_3600/g.13125  ORF Transcript_3600/g.13125 Transcript_3600/m.13125 type:complete len:386 (+) Transcript_3600:2898-4055(+)
MGGRHVDGAADGLGSQRAAVAGCGPPGAVTAGALGHRRLLHLARSRRRVSCPAAIRAAAAAAGGDGEPGRGVRRARRAVAGARQRSRRQHADRTRVGVAVRGHSAAGRRLRRRPRLHHSGHRAVAAARAHAHAVDARHHRAHAGQVARIHLPALHAAARRACDVDGAGRGCWLGGRRAPARRPADAETTAAGAARRGRRRRRRRRRRRTRARWPRRCGGRPESAVADSAHGRRRQAHGQRAGARGIVGRDGDDAGCGVRGDVVCDRAVARWPQRPRDGERRERNHGAGDWRWRRPRGAARRSARRERWRIRRVQRCGGGGGDAAGATAAAVCCARGALGGTRRAAVRVGRRRAVAVRPGAVAVRAHATHGGSGQPAAASVRRRHA